MASIEPSQYITLLNNSNIIVQNQNQDQNNIHFNINQNSSSTLSSMLQNFTNTSNLPNSSALASSTTSIVNNTNNLMSNDFDFLSECANSITLDKK